MKLIPFLTGFLLLTIFSCSPKNTAEAQTSASPKSNATMQSKTHTLELKQGEFFLVAIADQKENTEDLFQSYINKVISVAMENGFMPLGQLPIDKIVKANNFTPNNFVGLFKWPNMASIEAFSAKFPPEELKKLRMPIWEEFKAHMIIPRKDMKLLLKEILY